MSLSLETEKNKIKLKNAKEEKEGLGCFPNFLGLFGVRENQRTMMQTVQKQTLAQQLQLHHQQNQSQPPPLLTAWNSGNLTFSSTSNLSKEDDEEMTRSALFLNCRAKEEEIERKKMLVREKVQAQLGRVEEETKRLAMIREELEGLADPMRNDVAAVRKKIDQVDKELRPLGQSCQKKEREYKEALKSFNDKNKENVQLITKLMELVGESETLRMKKLEELSKNIDSLHIEK